MDGFGFCLLLLALTLALKLESFFINEKYYLFTYFRYFFSVIIYEHNYRGVAYNPLFHKEGETSGSTINAMPCGLGGSHDHKH